MAVYKRGDNWYIDFTFHGQRIREMIGPSRKGAEKVIAKRKAEIAENRFLDKRMEPDPISFYDFANEYLQWAKANKKPSSYNRDLSLMRQLNKEFEAKAIQEITTWQIEKFKAKRKEEVRPASVNREIALLKHMYSKAIEWSKVKESPVKKVKLLKGEVKRVRFLMPDQVQTLLSNCADHLRPIVTVAIHTGMRKGEILKLRRDQANFNQGIISILDTKNHERRDIPMNETVKATLKAIEDKGPYFFSNEDGKPFGDVKKAFATAMRKSGIEDFRFHDLRHTFASNLVMAGEDLNTIRELLGHKDLTMTLRYAHLAPNLKKKAVDVLDRIMSLNPPQSAINPKVVALTY
jgi:integrase